MLSAKEVLAVGFSCAAAMGGLAAGVQFQTMADARARAITAQSCELYDATETLLSKHSLAYKSLMLQRVRQLTQVI